MKKKLYIALAAGMFCMTLATGCEDRLNIAKHGDVGSQETYYQTDDEAEAAAAALYLSVRSQHYNWFFVKNLLSDDMYTGGGGRGDNGEMERLNEMTFGSDHGMITSLYSGLYNIVYNANLIIEKVAPDSEVKRRAIAEAKFFRAFSYFELVTLWGNVPKVDHLLTPDEYRKGNTPAEELWAFIESDLNAAVGDPDGASDLPSKENIDDDVTNIRVTKEAAMAYLGKAYLFQGKYNEAASILDKVISSNKYGLYQGEYGDLAHVKANNCRESILEAQMRNDPEQMWNQYTQLYCMLGWRSSMLNFDQSVSAFSQGCYGFGNPTKSLYDAFVAEETADGYRLNQTIITYKQLESLGISLRDGNIMVGNEGYFSWKYRALKEDCMYDNPGLQFYQYINLRFMRYAEVLLMAAEAHVQAGSGQDKALNYINEIRQRAQLAPLSTVTLDDIKTEKRLELCMEGVRYQDLIRWGDAEEVLKEQGHYIPSLVMNKKVSEEPTVNKEGFVNQQGYGFKKNKSELLPIPEKEMSLNPNMTQNPGW